MKIRTSYSLVENQNMVATPEQRAEWDRWLQEQTDQEWIDRIKKFDNVRRKD